MRRQGLGVWPGQNPARSQVPGPCWQMPGAGAGLGSRAHPYKAARPQCFLLPPSPQTAQAAFKAGLGQEVTWGTRCVRPRELGGQGGPLLLVHDPRWVKMGPRGAGGKEEREESTWKVLQVVASGCLIWEVGWGAGGVPGGLLAWQEGGPVRVRLGQRSGSRQKRAEREGAGEEEGEKHFP